jgi:hypothetical protein
MTLTAASNWSRDSSCRSALVVIIIRLFGHNGWPRERLTDTGLVVTRSGSATKALLRVAFGLFAGRGTGLDPAYAEAVPRIRINIGKDNVDSRLHSGRVRLPHRMRPSSLTHDAGHLADPRSHEHIGRIGGRRRTKAEN